MSQGDKFYALFLGDCALSSQCFFHCKYKYDHSPADIRIGDLWGETYKENEDGVSAAIPFTKRGKEIIEATNCELKEHPFKVVAQGQMKVAPMYKPWFESVIHSLADPKESINDTIKIIKRAKRKDRLLKLIHHPIKTIVCKLRPT